MFEAILYLLPLFALAVPLLRGRFLGERAIANMRERLASPRLPRAARVAASPRGTTTVLPRGGRLLASHLAVRPPPALPALT